MRYINKLSLPFKDTDRIMKCLSFLLVLAASTRKLYERKLQKLLDEGPAQPPLPEVIVTETQVNHNGNSESDLYSDKEDGKNNVTPFMICSTLRQVKGLYTNHSRARQ